MANSTCSRDGGPAFPSAEATHLSMGAHGQPVAAYVMSGGMSLRAYIATKMAAAFLMSPNTINGSRDFNDRIVAELACAMADRLIAELAKADAK
jgi:hypothetical protein